MPFSKVQVFINKSKIHFESKSQPEGTAKIKEMGCLSISQRYILKANHNTKTQDPTADPGVYQ